MPLAAWLWRGGTAQLGVPTAAEDFGLRALQLPKGDRPPAPVG